MKKFIKNIGKIVAVALVVFALSGVKANAQLGSPGTVISSTNLLGSATTGMPTGTISVANATKFAIQLSSVSSGANVSNTMLVVERTVNGSQWQSLALITIANTGTTAVNCISNFTGQADVTLRCYPTNSALSTITNTISATFNKLLY